MKDLIIVGAGGFGREVYYLAKSIGKWNIKGFIDDKQVDMADVQITEAKWIGTIKDWVPSENEVFALGIASPKAKESVSNILKEKGARFETLIAPTAYVNSTTILGEGCVVGGRAWVGDCNRIGNFVNIAGSSIGQDVEIGDYTTTTAHTNVPSGKIGKRVFIGSMAVVLANVEDDATVAAGSIVMRKVKSGTKVMGNPAKRMDI